MSSVQTNTTIVKFEFTQAGASNLQSRKKGVDWPVVYILNGNKEAYVGETSSAYQRMCQHLDNPTRKVMKEIRILFNDTFNKSAILDIENMLIEHMMADGLFVLQNQNNGQSKYHDYFQRGLYQEIFKDIWEQLKKQKVVSHSLLQVENSDVFKYSPFKELTAQQYDIERTLLVDIADALSKDGKQNIVIQGGAGTGKSILAISTLKYISDLLSTEKDYHEPEDFDDSDGLFNDYELNKKLSAIQNLKIGIIEPVTQFRETVKSIFRSIKSLKKVDVLSADDITRGEPYDILFVDEAHRLKRFHKLTNNGAYLESCKRIGLDQTSSQLDWVMARSKITVLFYDEIQSVSASDTKKRDFDEILSKPYTKKYDLTNQLRLKAGKEYIEFWNHLLRNEVSDEDKLDIYLSKYDFRVFDDCNEMFEEIKKKNKEMQGLCRMVAGYSFKWGHKIRDKVKNIRAEGDYDFEIQGHKYNWNNAHEQWATDDRCVSEIGCVHTCQGYDLNVAGVIFGPDITFNQETKKIEYHPDNYFDTNANDRKDVAKTIENIINSYMVLLTRGIKGTYVYAVDEKLREYIKSKFVSLS